LILILNKYQTKPQGTKNKSTRETKTK